MCCFESEGVNRIRVQIGCDDSESGEVVGSTGRAVRPSQTRYPPPLCERGRASHYPTYVKASRSPASVELCVTCGREHCGCYGYGTTTLARVELVCLNVKKNSRGATILARWS